MIFLSIVLQAALAVPLLTPATGNLEVGDLRCPPPRGHIEGAGDHPRFEQAFSADGGRTWETNWTTDYTRVSANDVPSL